MRYLCLVNQHTGFTLAALFLPRLLLFVASSYRSNTHMGAWFHRMVIPEFLIESTVKLDVREFRNAYTIEFRNTSLPCTIGFLLACRGATFARTTSSRKFCCMRALRYCALHSIWPFPNKDFHTHPSLVAE